MSKHQLHGKKYEDYLKSAFPGSADYGRKASNRWDIERKFDKERNLPTSIKTAKNAKSPIVCLADARTFWLTNEHYRLLVALFNQEEKLKKFHTLHEFIITSEEHKKLLGTISYEEVRDFHEKVLSYKLGEHVAGRLFAKQTKNRLKNKSIVQLNHKIDSGIQRRVQCSISLSDLICNIAQKNTFSSDDFYRDTLVSHTIRSTKREFRL